MGKIDQPTQDLATYLCNQAGTVPEYPFALEGGGFVPAWAMYVSEAVKLIKQANALKQVKSK